MTLGRYSDKRTTSATAAAVDDDALSNCSVCLYFANPMTGEYTLLTWAAGYTSQFCIEKITVSLYIDTFCLQNSTDVYLMYVKPLS